MRLHFGGKPAADVPPGRLATVPGMLRRALVVPVLPLLAAALTACGGSSGPVTEAPPPLTSASQTTTPTVPTTTTPTTPTTTATTTTPTTPATTPVTTTPARTTTAPSTTPGGAPAGCPGAIGGFVRDVQASGTDCTSARSVAQAWFSAVHGGASPASQISAAGYSCGGSMSGERASVRCTGSGGAAVSFTASP